MKYNLYSTLGVKPNATETEIKKGYRKIAKENHPDKNPNNKTATKKMLDANEAYEVLSDKVKKKKYDEALMAHLQREIAKEKAKTQTTQQKSTNRKTATETKSEENIGDTIVEAGKSVLASILRVILGR